MIKLYVDQMLDKDGKWARITVQDSDTKLDCTFDNKGNLVRIEQLLGDTPVKLELTEEELIFINEQLEVKEVECFNSLSIEEMREKEKTIFAPAMFISRFRIKEKALEVTAHYFNGELIGFTTPYYCSYDKELKHISLNLRKEIEKKLMRDEMRLSVPTL